MTGLSAILIWVAGLASHPPAQPWQRFASERPSALYILFILTELQEDFRQYNCYRHLADRESFSGTMPRSSVSMEMPQAPFRPGRVLLEPALMNPHVVSLLLLLR